MSPVQQSLTTIPVTFDMFQVKIIKKLNGSVSSGMYVKTKKK